MENTKQKTFELSVRSTTEELSAIRDFIRQSISPAGITDEAMDKIILAVDEASTNVVKHAYHYAKDKEIKIQLELKSESCVVTITDFGDSFDPNEIPQPNMKQYLEEKRVGGLGLYLMRTLMDEVQYTSYDGKYNKLVLIKKISA
ncbi:MAG: ATP-binding protein [Ignavibacteriaceae bacterium]|nr:ATP-binding protein [Ignavibacteriaceae bacterium]